MSSMGSTTQAMQAKLMLLIQGDPKAKNELIELAYERLVIVTRRLLGSFSGVRTEEETQGVLAEAWIRLHSSLEDVKPQTARQFMGLAALEIRRVLLDKIRKMRGRKPGARPRKVSLDANPEGSGTDKHDLPDSDFLVEKQDLAIDLLEAVEQLNEEFRETVEMLFFHGLTQAESAEILGVHEDTIKRRWAKARVILAQKLEAFS